jgi:hypothetical protein
MFGMYFEVEEVDDIDEDVVDIQEAQPGNIAENGGEVTVYSLGPKLDAQPRRL